MVTTYLSNSYLHYTSSIPEQHKIIFNHNVILNGVRLNQDYTIKHSDLKEIESKSSYHWRSLCKAEVSFQGEKLKEESSDGWFIYLGWTANLELGWGNKNTLIEIYQNTVKLLLSEKGLTVNQKIRTTNAIASSTIG